MQESEIKQAIQTKIGQTKYEIWTIGITEDLQRRKSEHDSKGQDTKYWKDWKADTEDIARSVEAYFIDKGMKGGTGGGGHPSYVYIF